MHEQTGKAVGEREQETQGRDLPDTGHIIPKEQREDEAGEEVEQRAEEDTQRGAGVGAADKIGKESGDGQHGELSQREDDEITGEGLLHRTWDYSVQWVKVISKDCTQKGIFVICLTRIAV